MNTLALLALIANSEIEHGIPPGLLQALCTVESNLNPYAHVEVDGKSGRSSIGLCQVQLRTASHFYPGISAKELAGPGPNAYAAGAYLAFNYRRYRSWNRAVVAYNRGSSNGGSTEYSRKVMEIYGRNKKHKGVSYQTSTRRGDYTDRSIRFLREDYTYAD